MPIICVERELLQNNALANLLAVFYSQKMFFELFTIEAGCMKYINENESITLIEFIVVITIMAVLAAIEMPSFVEYIERVKELVCNTNCMQLEKMYE